MCQGSRGMWFATWAILLCLFACSPDGGKTPGGKAPSAPQMPAHWKLVYDFQVPVEQVKAMIKKDGADLCNVRNMAYDVNGKRVRLNVVIVPDPDNAEKVMTSLKSIKDEDALLRKGLIIYEFCGKNEAILEIAEGRKYLDSTSHVLGQADVKQYSNVFTTSERISRQLSYYLSNVVYKVKGIFVGDVGLVKKGMLKFEGKPVSEIKMTIGQAIDNYKYFKKTKWELVTNDNGAKSVQVTCNYDPSAFEPLVKDDGYEDGYKDVYFENKFIKFQFQVNQDKTIKLVGCSYGTDENDISKIERLMTADLRWYCKSDLIIVYFNERPLIPMKYTFLKSSAPLPISKIMSSPGSISEESASPRPIPEESAPPPIDPPKPLPPPPPPTFN